MPPNKKKNVAVSVDSLSICSSQGGLATVKLLLDAGVEANAKNSRGSNALIEASWAGKQEVVSYLLAAKADVNFENSAKTHPTSCCARSEARVCCLVVA